MRLRPFFSCAGFLAVSALSGGTPAPEGSPSRFLLPGGSSETVAWVALDARPGPGSSIVAPGFLRTGERGGPRAFTAFSADTLLAIDGGRITGTWRFEDYRWRTGRTDWRIEADRERLLFSSEREEAAAVAWFREGPEGTLAPRSGVAVRGGGDVYLPYYYKATDGGWVRRGRFGDPSRKPVIYQMLPRLFGNENETRKKNGTLPENGTGKFSDLDQRALEVLRESGFNHVWVTGVLQQATSTDYPEVGQPADDPDLLKGIAGSPYAIKDYFDVSPDYADDPANRLGEFRAMVGRAHEAGLRIVIDLVANHVARSYRSDVRPELSFGEGDRTDRFFDPENNFFYLTEEVVGGGETGPLVLPTIDPVSGRVVSDTARVVGGADGRYPPENRVARVTGNNVVDARPSTGDWYETVKLNFGFNFLEPGRAPAHPSAITPEAPMPDTWTKMDEIVAYWQEMGVDGFRADMAHLIPPEFWKWLIHRARQRDPDVFFFAEAYDDDPAKVPSHDPALRADDGVMVSLLDAGFAAVYDDPGYDTLEHLYAGKAWANDLDRAEASLGPFFFDCAVRYAENHDEIRLANPATWGGAGAEVGRAVAGALFGLSRGPVMVYNGQMVGEKGEGAEGFGGADARTTIFDYWSMPAFNDWWNGGALDGGGLPPRLRELRAWYVRLLDLLQEPAFAAGTFHPLNPANADNPFYGRIDQPDHSGRWFYSYVRYDPLSGDRALVAVNFHPTAAARHVRIRFPEEMPDRIGLDPGKGGVFLWEELLPEPGRTIALPPDRARREGLYLREVPALTTRVFRWTRAAEAPADASVPPVAEGGGIALGAIPVHRLAPGETRVLDLRRFGDPGDTHRFRLSDTGPLEAVVDEVNLRLRLSVPEDAGGLHPIRLELVPRAGEGKVLSTWLPVAVEPRPLVRLRWEGGDGAESVAVAGDFNGWNPAAGAMRREDGAWVAGLRLPPGVYRYKLVVDGEFRPDPGNPNREPDGYGGENSLLRVERRPGTEPPRPFASSVDESVALFSLGGDTEGFVAFADEIPVDGGSRRLPVRRTGDRVAVDLDGVGEGSLVRLVAANGAGRTGPAAIAYAPGPRGDTWRDDIIYYAFTDRFVDGEPANNDPVEHPELAEPANYQGGDFQGITARIRDGYFEDLGVNVLWLAPVNRNPDTAWREYLPPYRYYSGYHGYWPVDNRGIEPRFGGEPALRELIGEAHGEGMKVIADLVLKHVHSEHPLWKERRDLFGTLEASDGTRNLRRWEEAPFTTWFEPFLPAFDFRNPDTVERRIGESLYWLEDYGLDGYRLDAVKHIRPAFWWKFRGRIEEEFPGNDFYFVGETFGNRERILSFVGPNMLDGQFDFPLYDVLMEVFARETRGFPALEDALRASEATYGKITPMSPLLGNHDKERFMAVADGDLPDPEEPDAEEVGWKRPPEVDDPASYDKLKLAMTFLLAIDGVPMIYYGDEVGMTGAGDPDNRRMMLPEEELSPEQVAVRDHFSRLAKGRAANPALSLGSRRPLVVEGDHYAFVRAHLDNRAVVLFNRSDRPRRFELDLSPEIGDAELFGLLGGRSLTVRGGSAVVTVPARSSEVFVGQG